MKKIKVILVNGIKINIDVKEKTDPLNTYTGYILENNQIYKFVKGRKRKLIIDNIKKVEE